MLNEVIILIVNDFLMSHDFELIRYLLAFVYEFREDRNFILTSNFY